jgi:hypothetical protein
MADTDSGGLMQQQLRNIMQQIININRFQYIKKTFQRETSLTDDAKTVA